MGGYDFPKLFHKYGFHENPVRRRVLRVVILYRVVDQETEIGEIGGF